MSMMCSDLDFDFDSFAQSINWDEVHIPHFEDLGWKPVSPKPSTLDSLEELSAPQSPTSSSSSTVPPNTAQLPLENPVPQSPVYPAPRTEITPEKTLARMPLLDKKHKKGTNKSAARERRKELFNPLVMKLSQKAIHNPIYAREKASVKRILASNVPWTRSTVAEYPLDLGFIDSVFRGDTIYAVPTVDFRPLLNEER
ncbi:hypothetical protein D9613_004816 [Agrocybe pediades]|uniref:Uncharacterized protein n=1 Tax=Agrocybe pediades TaxID=84607 RepID=A0A8H4QY34_9AGAR|nr:hypothetical protein D9613_004816 [Agrocybe pediades]